MVSGLRMPSFVLQRRENNKHRAINVVVWNVVFSFILRNGDEWTAVDNATDLRN